MSFNGKTLIVDDEPHVRKYVGLVLKSIGITTVIEASNGKLGFELYQSEKPELVLLDVNMPIQDGLETLKQIHAFDPDAVVIMLTSLATRQVIDDAIDHGAVNYIRKDTPKDELVALLRKTLDDVFSTDSEPEAS